MASETQIVDRLKRGEEEAFSELYEIYSAPLLNHLLTMTGKIELAEELLHEVLMTMLTKINFYEEDKRLKNSFKAWLYRIATNRAIDEIRKTKNVKFEEATLELVDSKNIEEDFELIERDEKIQDFLNRLPLMQRTFMNLKINSDLNHLEISRICSCQVNTVKQGLFQARRTLKNMLLAEGVEL